VSESNQSNDNTSEMICAIEAIAFQSDLLALNAAAGADAQGFAAAANEVRTLARLGSQTRRPQRGRVDG